MVMVVMKATMIVVVMMMKLMLMVVVMVMVVMLVMVVVMVVLVVVVMVMVVVLVVVIEMMVAIEDSVMPYSVEPAENLKFLKRNKLSVFLILMPKIFMMDDLYSWRCSQPSPCFLQP